MDKHIVCGTHVPPHVSRSEDNLWEYSLFLLLCGVRNQTQVIRLGSRCLTRRAISPAVKQELHTENILACVIHRQGLSGESICDVLPAWGLERSQCLWIVHWKQQTPKVGTFGLERWLSNYELSQRTQDQSPTPNYRSSSALSWLPWVLHTHHAHNITASKYSYI